MLPCLTVVNGICMESKWLTGGFSHSRKWAESMGTDVRQLRGSRMSLFLQDGRSGSLIYNIQKQAAGSLLKEGPKDCRGSRVNC